MSRPSDLDDRTSSADVPSRRFAPPAGFLCGATHLEVTAAACELVWGNGSRVPYPGVTLARALRLVARGTWEELPPARPRRRRFSAFPAAHPSVLAQ